MARAAGEVAVVQTGSLAGQVAVVTGSGGAMGGAIAERLAAAGAHIVLNDRVPIASTFIARPSRHTASRLSR